MRTLIVAIQLNRFVALLFFSALLAMVQPVGAQSAWNAIANTSANTNWSTAGNWSPSGIPGSSTTVVFNDSTGQAGTTTNSVVDGGSFGGTISSLNFTNLNTQQNVLIASGGTLNITGVGGLMMSNPVVLATAVSPVTTISGGGGKLVVNNSSANVMVDIGEPSTTGTATLNMTNLDTFNFTGSQLLVGVAGLARSTGVLFLARTNMLALTGPSPQIDVGDNGGNNGNASTLNLGQTNAIYADNVAMGRQKQSTSPGGLIRFNPSFTNANPVAYFRAHDGVSAMTSWAICDGGTGGGTPTCTGTSDFTSGTVNAVVNAMWVARTSSSGTASATTAKGTLTFTAGTINVNNLTNGLQSSAVAHTVTAAINVNGSAKLTVNNNLVMAVLGTSTGGTAGSLNITNGTVLANSIVSAGGTSTVNVNGGTLSITNTAGSSASPLTALNLVAGTLHLNLNGTANVTNIVAASVGATGGATTITIDSIINVPGSLTLPLISYTGTDPFANLTLNATLPAGYAGSLVDNAAGHRIDINISSSTPSLVWVGAVGNTLNSSWDTSTLNWLNGATPAAYADPDNIQFDDTASNSVVTLTAAFAPGVSIVTNNVLNYAFSGAGKITGKVIIDNASGVMSGTTIIGPGGTVQLGNNDAGGTLPSSILTDNGTLLFTNSANVGVSNTISGSGAMVQNDTNVVTLNGTNSLYTGNITVQQGTLRVNNTNALGSWAAGTVTITNGGTLDIGGFNTAIAQGNADFGAKQFIISGAGVGGNGAINNTGPNQQLGAFQNITLGANATIGGTNRWDMRNGTVTLNLNGFTLTKTNSNQISLVSPAINGGNIIIGQGTLSFETTLAFSGSGGITVNSGGIMGQFRVAMGTFTRPVTLNGGAIQNLASSGTFGTNDAPITLTASSSLVGGSSAAFPLFLNGIISESTGSFGLTKSGTGPMDLTAAETYSGTTAVNSGVLALSGGGSINSSKIINVASSGTLDPSARTDGTLTLTAGQTLTGSGTVAGITSVSSGATLAEGASGVGSMALTNLLLQSGGTNAVEVSDAAGAAGTGYDTLAVSGNIGVPATSGSPFIVKVVSLAAVNFNNASSYSWTIATGTVTNFAPGSIAVDASGFTNDLAGGTFNVSTNGPATALVLTFTPDAGPVTTAANYDRVKGLSLKIAISDLVATNWSNASGYAVVLTNSASSTNGATISHDANYIYYTNPNNVADQINYTVTDVNPNYRAGDTHHTAAGIINIAVVSPGAGPVVNQITASGGVVTLNLAGIPNYTYWIQVTTNLPDPSAWQVISTNTAGANGLYQFIDNDATNTPVGIMRAYRLQQAN